MSFFAELKRRNVLRVGAAYAALAWLVIQIVETLFPLFDLTNAAARVVVILLAIGSVPVVILAWAFELTPEGLRREASVDHDSESSRQGARRLDRLVMVFLALAVGYFALDKFVLDPGRDLVREREVAEKARSDALLGSFAERSIAVLAFDDLSPARDQEYFSDGISEELLNLLARIPELRVAGRTSAFSFKGKDATIAQIGAALNVAHVLEGSVRRAGDRIRVTVQLIDARTDTHLWSQTYDRTFGDIFAIQDEIASKVVDELRITLLGAMPQVRKTDPQAYALYLQAAQALSRMTAESPQLAEGLLEQALAIDPQYAPAWVLMAAAQRYYATWGRKSREEATEQAAGALRHALEIDPGNADAGVRLALLDPRADTDWQYFSDVLTEGLARSPSNLDFARWAANHYLELGRVDRGVTILERLVLRDPLCTQCLYSLARAGIYAGRLDVAEDAIRRYMALNAGGGHTLGRIFLLQGHAEAALAEFDRLGDSQPLPVVLHGRALALHGLGRIDEFDAVFAELREQHSDPIAGAVFDPPGMIAEIYAWIDDVDGAFEWLERASAVDGYGPRFLHVDPMFANLHDDPRWNTLLARTNRTPEQLAAIRFDVDPLHEPEGL